MRSPGPSPLLLVGVAAVVVLALGHTGELRDRAAIALGRGMPEREAELARGFVLGEDDRIDPRTVEDFRRSGLAHLLAVSGQNVALLALLALPLLAALGIPLRMRLVWVLGLIAVYVPLAGAGPSILRAGVMGALSVLATLAGRRSSRLYALALAAGLTLAIDPRIGADVGWQLSFAAVVGILALAPPLRRGISARIGRGGLRGAFSEGAAVTISATLATAPLVAFHFGALSTTTLLANVAALPAVAPAMWLGMLAAAAGQVPGLPVEALNALNAPLLAYIAQVAAWAGRPRWAYLELQPGPAGLLGAYLALALAAAAVPRCLRSRRIALLRSGRRPGARRRPCGVGIALASTLVAASVWLFAPGGSGVPAASATTGLRVSVLDVGQGDAILLQPRGAPAVLVDTGPPGGGLVAELDRAGVERIGAVLVTHDESDHAGGLAELFSAVAVGDLLYAELGGRAVGLARAAGIGTGRIQAGDVLWSGGLRLEVLWPPAERIGATAAGEDPNLSSVVAVARWRRFSILLCGDAEAEATPLDPGPIDVLKVAHHGSEDAGLDALLATATPKLAVVSAGAGNPFGHPAPATLATLAAHGVPVLRTDRDGTIVIDVGRNSVGVASPG